MSLTFICAALFYVLLIREYSKQYVLRLQQKLLLLSDVTGH